MVCHRAPRVHPSVVCALFLLLLTFGCGELHFLPSPFSPQYVELIYSEQEHLTVVRWRVDAPAPVEATRFEMLGPDNQYHPIDFDKSAFPGGVIDCGDGRGACAQYVVRGKYEIARTSRPVQAVHDVYGILPGGFATTRSVSTTLAMESFFHSGNDIVFARVTKDDVGRAGPYSFPRKFERTIWPTGGLCIADTAPTDVMFSLLDEATGFPPPTPLTVAGTYCVATRPIPSDEGDRAMVQVKIATLPEIQTLSQFFEPPIERSPIIYQIVLDLEIPVPDRCADVTEKIETLIDRYFKKSGVSTYWLSIINLAEDALFGCA